MNRPELRIASPPRRGTVRGFTLVELMISIIIGLILVAAVVSLFVSMRSTYGFQESLSRVQENGRFVSQMLSRELRMAGFSGCNRNIFNWLNPAGTGYVESIYGDQAVFGWEFSGTGPGDSYTVGTAGNWVTSNGEALPAALDNPLPGSDILVVNRAEPLDVVLQGNPSPPANTINAAGDTGIPGRAIIMAVTSGCSGGDMWQKTSAANSVTLPKGTATGFDPGNINPSGGFSQVYDDDSQILRRMSTAYYVRQNPAGEPALYRRRLDPGGTDNIANPGNAGQAFTSEEMVEGVENMQVLYGEDTSGNRQPNRYVAADGVADWTRIVSVRVSLLIRSAERAQTMSELTDFNVGYTQVRPTEGNRVRQLFHTTIAVRNRLP